MMANSVFVELNLRSSKRILQTQAWDRCSQSLKPQLLPSTLLIFFLVDSTSEKLERESSIFFNVAKVTTLGTIYNNTKPSAIMKETSKGIALFLSPVMEICWHAVERGKWMDTIHGLQ